MMIVSKIPDNQRESRCGALYEVSEENSPYWTALIRDDNPDKAWEMARKISDALEANPAPVVFTGIQEGVAHIPPEALYRMLAPVGSLVVHSTVTRKTLDTLGMTIPARELLRECKGWQTFVFQGTNDCPKNGQVSSDIGHKDGQSGNQRLTIQGMEAILRTMCGR